MPRIDASGRRILLIWPEIPRTTYWSFSKALELVGASVNSPPLGLATVAALLPDGLELRLHDVGVRPLTDDDVRWADAVFISAMIVQKDGVQRAVAQADRLGVPVVAGGPYPSVCYAELPGVDHFVIGEAEAVLPAFVRDWRRGTPRRAYARPVDQAEVDELRAHFGDDADVALATERPCLDGSPVPRFDLFDTREYRTMAVQFSRGCPVGCEFCDIWTRLGLRPRFKSPATVIDELEAVLATGWTGSVFIVDDNFVGHLRRTHAILDAIVAWQREHDYPFTFYTEASLRLADKPELLRKMHDAAFDMVFLGIETPSQESLEETGKHINRVEHVADQVAAIQSHGIEVTAGFIIGFDHDPPDIAERMIRFVEELGIPLAMVGLLEAPPKSRLWDRMEREGRLLSEFSGNNTHDFATNFRPLIPVSELVGRYKQVLQALYSPTMRSFFDRCATYRRRWVPNRLTRWRFSWAELGTTARSLWVLGKTRYGARYWAFLVTTLVVKPRFLAQAIRLGIQGYHLREITAGAFELDRLGSYLGNLRARFGAAIDEQGARAREWLDELDRIREQRLEQVTPALEERYAALRQQATDASQRLDALKAELLAEARRRAARTSREYEDRIRAMVDSLEQEMERMERSLTALSTLQSLPAPG